MTNSGNVRPLRPPPPKKAFDLRDPETLARTVYATALGAFVILWLGKGPVDMIGLGLGVAALAIAVSKRDEATPWLRTHHEFVLRTIVIGGAVWTLAALLYIIPFIGGVFIAGIHIATLLWVLARCVFGFMKLASRKAIANPTTLLI
jgi:uncharacterized membrane protein